MNYYKFKELNVLILITIIILLIILKAQGCHVMFFDKEIIKKNVTFISMEIKTKYCFSDRRVCNFVNRVPKTKIVEEFQLIPRKKCCTGYQETENGECLPICHNCENGKCIYTDFCVCNAGYRRNYALNKCVSRCDTECINADCVGNNECKCHKGYKFLIDSQTECIPECTKGNQCLNGECIEPDICNCKTGYKKNQLTEICEPICNEPCQNGTCTGINECSCIQGYTLKNNSLTICEPTCSSGCTNGVCIDAEKCKCNEGYNEEIEEIIEQHGNSNNDDDDDEDDDDDDDGIVYTTSEIITIRKICKPVCPKGCVNGICTKPNICECQSGYKHLENHHIQNNETNLCIPVCENQCVNGNCISPNLCECHIGYRHNINNLTVCEPICEKNCHKNGYCAAPNKCSCNIGFIKWQDNCYSKCELTCHNGICNDDHNKCICSDGYDHPDTNSTLQCTPVCEPKCGNGVCIKPNHCLCHQGFEYDENLKKCMIPCPENAICNEHTNDNKFIITKCIQGYQLQNNNNKSVCEPICEKNCKNGKCIGPNICECLTGYDNTKENYELCEPNCNPLCINSNCIEPNVCKCLNGYHKTNITLINECTPICPDNDCINGYCIAPNQCQCLDDYKLSDINRMICEPICDKPICNTNISKCIAPNVCDCLEGYELIISNSTTSNKHDTDITTDFMNSSCVPICNNINCTHGICISPNKCECSDGYIFNSNKTICEPISTVEINAEMNIIEKSKSGSNLGGIIGTCVGGICLVALIIVIGVIVKKRLRNRGEMNLNLSSFNLMNPVYDHE